MGLRELKKEIRENADRNHAKLLQRFFKTGEGEYGEGDVFLGIPVVKLRRIIKGYKDLSLNEIEVLVKSEFHEERFAAICFLIERFENDKKQVYDIYLKNIRSVNSWDLVDISAGKIIGGYLFEKPKDLLFRLAISKDLWRRRVAIMSTSCFIRNNQFDDTLKIAEILLKDEHDLIHKAVGWMLREVGNRDMRTEEKFLRKHYKHMPRTMLRYAIEKFPEEKRKRYLKGNV